MTIDELIAELTELKSELGGDTRVIVSSDDEGNEFRLLGSTGGILYGTTDGYSVETAWDEDGESYDETAEMFLCIN